MYEYKFLPTPLQTCQGERLKNDRKAMVGSLDSEATMLSASGWDFVRFDRVPVANRRFILFSVKGERSVTVYRRPIREPGAAANLPGLAYPPNAAKPPVQVEEEQVHSVRPRRISRLQKRDIPAFLMVPGPAGEGSARLA
ncbi:MAG: hypothetical protein WBB85_19685 [Albidovulum sp.]|uniref:hypothetical protein n=1 Tax=Albidovulum sp. TaxID=1872424 RepID=UPI003C8F9FD6